MDVQVNELWSGAGGHGHDIREPQGHYLVRWLARAGRCDAPVGHRAARAARVGTGPNSQSRQPYPPNTQNRPGHQYFRRRVCEVARICPWVRAKLPM